MTSAELLWVHLTPSQADGLACVVCDVNFLHPGAGAHVPVGRSGTGSQVFACSTHTSAAVRESIARRRVLAAADRVSPALTNADTAGEV